jgi:hypothetical protein
MDEKVAKMMRLLDISEEEAVAMLEEDKRIDRGEKLYELPPELAGGAKKARQAPRKQPTAPIKREKKVDADKKHLMNIIKTAIGYNANTTDFEFVNDERECLFIYNGKKYKIVLSCPRS